MKITLITLILGLPFLMISGCVNPYAQFYHSFTGNQPAQFLDGYEPCDSQPEIVSCSNFERDTQELYRNGYVPLGISSFNGPARALNRANIIEQATKVGACKVLTASNYTHTVSGAVPLTVPDASTSYTNSNIHAYDSQAGSINLYGNSTTTTYGSQTVMVPFSRENYDVAAIYFFKKHFTFGARFDAVPPDLSAKIGQNGGLLVLNLVRGSPAYRADIFEGDVLLFVDGEKLDLADNRTKFNEILQRNSGRTISVLIWRNGETIKKVVSLLSN